VNGEIRVVDSVTESFARLVAETINAHTDRDGFSLFLSGGSTAEECYRELAALTGEGATDGIAVDWPGVDVYLGDERCVPLSDKDSNYKMISEVLLDKVGPVRSDLPMYRSGEPDMAAAAYQRLIEPLGTLDLIHLGVGPDGHTASLFPDSAALAISDPHSLVVANSDPKGNNPHDRITLTMPGIAKGRLVVFTVSGESKGEAFRRILAGEDLPASRVTAEQVVWLVDQAAVGDAELPA
jgi:6-phosphogluconolactonase